MESTTVFSTTTRAPNVFYKGVEYAYNNLCSLYCPVYSSCAMKKGHPVCICHMPREQGEKTDCVHPDFYPITYEWPKKVYAMHMHEGNLTSLHDLYPFTPRPTTPSAWEQFTSSPLFKTPSFWAGLALYLLISISCLTAFCYFFIKIKRKRGDRSGGPQEVEMASILPPPLLQALPAYADIPPPRAPTSPLIPLRDHYSRSIAPNANAH